MMTAFLAWAAAPLVWTLLCLGLGMGVRTIVSHRLPMLLTVPVGYALFVVISTLTTAWHVTAILTMPLVVVLAAFGAWVGRADLRRWRAGIAPGVAALLVFVLYGLPALISGSPFAGWIKLDDGATWLAFSDRLADAGRTTAGLAPSTYEALLQINWDGLTWGGPYPLGVFPPLGGVGKLLGVDAAWLLQPYLVFLAAVLALGVYAMLRPFVDRVWLLVTLTVLASTPALLLGYSLWGGIKEMALTPLFLVATILVVRRYATLPLAVVASACMVIAGFSAGTWLAVPLLFWLVVTVRQRKWISLVVMVMGAAVMSLPLLVKLTPAIVASLLEFASGSDDIGNLSGSLDRLQVLGIWPAGDFREAPAAMAPVSVLLVVVVVLAALGIWRAAVQGQWEMPLYLGNVVLIALLFSFGNAWISGKALAMAAPAPLIAAGVGIGWLWSERRLIEAAVGLALVSVGVLWSYALAYHDVWLAPAAQLEELRVIGENDSLATPALMLEYSPYGVRHFLRDLDAEGAGELRRRTIPTVDGGTVDKGEYADIDEISQQGLADFPTLVLRRSPLASRPPSNYSRVWSGLFYDVWQRDSQTTVVSHTPFGDAVDPGQIPQCEVIEQIAATAEPDDRLAFVEPPPLVVVPLGPQGVILPESPTRITQTFTVDQPGDFDLALGGSFTGQVTLSIDDREVWQGRHQLNWTGNTTPMGQVRLSAGEHELTLDYSVSLLRPGSGGASWPLGPVYLSPAGDDVRFVSASDAGSLCGKRLDWLEVVR